MKTFLFLLYTLLYINLNSQVKDIQAAIKNKDYKSALPLAKEYVKSDPKSFKSNFLMAYLNDRRGDFKLAIPYLDSAKKFHKNQVEYAWVHLEKMYNNFGQGNLTKASESYSILKGVQGDKETSIYTTKYGMLMGFDAFYATWNIENSKDIIFHLDPTIPKGSLSQIISSHQRAYDSIQKFFGSNLPKKIDLFVWNQTDNFNPKIQENLGYTDPVLCLSHVKVNQSPGFEIVKSITFWYNNHNSPNSFITKGLSVCFNQNQDDKMTAAEKAYQAKPTSIYDLWTNNSYDDRIVYPISGAFVQYLKSKDKSKFLQLVVNQSYKDAFKIYNSQIDDFMREFVNLLKKNTMTTSNIDY